MPSIIGGAIRGAAQVAVPVLLEGHKADILAERDAALAKIRAGEIAEGRAYKTKERLAGQEFTAGQRVLGEEARITAVGEKQEFEAGESELERKSREKIAITKRGGGTKIIPGQGFYDYGTGELTPFPELPEEKRKRALAMAKVDVESDANLDLDKPETVREMADRYYDEMTQAPKAKVAPPQAEMFLREKVDVGGKDKDDALRDFEEMYGYVPEWATQAPKGKEKIVEAVPTPTLSKEAESALAKIESKRVVPVGERVSEAVGGFITRAQQQRGKGAAATVASKKSGFERLIDQGTYPDISLAQELLPHLTGKYKEIAQAIIDRG